MTDSSDQLENLYDPSVKRQIERQLNKFTEQPLDRLDRVLIKGVFTNNRDELENPPLVVNPEVAQKR